MSGTVAIIVLLADPISIRDLSTSKNLLAIFTASVGSPLSSSKRTVILSPRISGLIELASSIESFPVSPHAESGPVSGMVSSVKTTITFLIITL